MATTTKKSTHKKKSQPEEISLKINVEMSGEPERVYSNHVNVRLNPMDSTLEFCDLGLIDTNRIKDVRDKGEVTIRPKVRIVLPLEVFKRLSTVMSRLVEENLVEDGESE